MMDVNVPKKPTKNLLELTSEYNKIAQDQYRNQLYFYVLAMNKRKLIFLSIYSWT